MDNDTPPEKPSFTAEHQGEVLEIISVDQLPEALGFIETDELRQIRPQLVGAMLAQDQESVRELATRYHLLGEEVVNQPQNEDFAKAQIGLMVALALARRDAGRHADYVADLMDALTYASAMNFSPVGFSLMQAIVVAHYGEEASLKVTKIDIGSDTPVEYLRKKGIIE